MLGEDVDKSYSSTGSATTGGVAGDYQLDATSEDTQSHKPWPRPPDVPAPQTEPDAPETLPQAYVLMKMMVVLSMTMLRVVVCVCIFC